MLGRFLYCENKQTNKQNLRKSNSGEKRFILAQAFGGLIHDVLFPVPLACGKIAY